MFKGKSTENLIKASMGVLSESLPDLVTFNSSIVDQMQWERVSNVELTDGTSQAECDLFALINEFCCNAILPSIVGTQFTESYQLLGTDLATFNQCFWALALGLPRFSPIQGLPGAALAQRRLLTKFTSLFEDLTDPPVRRVPDDDESVSGEETDADIATPLTKLNELFMKSDVPMEVRAATALQAVHSVVAEVVPLVFWTILHIYSLSTTQETQESTETPLEKIKEETKSWAQAMQPPSIHPSFPAPPEIRFPSADAALTPTSFPYLHSCINESRRLYNCPLSTYKLTKPITLQEPSITRPGKQDEWTLDINSYIDIGLSQTLINSSPTTYSSPSTFQPTRFLANPTPPSIVSPTDPSHLYKTALLASLISGITQLWDLAPAPKKSFLEHMQEAGAEASMGAAALSGEQNVARHQAPPARQDDGNDKTAKWVIPKTREGAYVRLPTRDVRVRVRRREGLPGSRVVGRIG